MSNRRVVRIHFVRTANHSPVCGHDETKRKSATQRYIAGCLLSLSIEHVDRSSAQTYSYFKRSSKAWSLSLDGSKE